MNRYFLIILGICQLTIAQVSRDTAYFYYNPKVQLDSSKVFHAEKNYNKLRIYGTRGDSLDLLIKKNKAVFVKSNKPRFWIPIRSNFSYNLSFLFCFLSTKPMVLVSPYHEKFKYTIVDTMEYFGLSE